MQIKIVQTGAKQATDEQKKLAKSIKDTGSTANQTDKEMSALGQKFSGLAESLTSGVGLIAAVTAVSYALIRFTKSSIETAASFETLQTRLTALYQSANVAAGVFQDFKEIAATTPFSVQEVVSAGAALKSFGVDAQSTLKSVADLAAFMGVDIVTAAQSMGRAFAGGAGAADVLRERGVLELVRSFKGIEDLTKITLPEFREALISTMQDETAGIAGSTKLLSETLVGSISNMNDAIDSYKAAMGENFIPITKFATRVVTAFFKQLTPEDEEIFVSRNQLKEATDKINEIDEAIKIQGENERAEINKIVQAARERIKLYERIDELLEQTNIKMRGQLGQEAPQQQEYHEKELEAYKKLVNAQLNVYDEEFLLPMTENTKSKWQELGESMDAILVGSFSSAFADMLVDGKANWSNLMDYMKRELIKLAASEAFMSIVKYLSGGKGGSNKEGGFFSNLFGGIISNLFGGGNHFGGSAYNVGNGNVLRGASTGTEFIVPNGFPNDSYLQPVQSGERVSVSSAADTKTMLGLYNKMVNLLSAINNTLQIQGNAPVVIRAEGSLSGLVQNIDAERNNMIKKLGYDGYGSSYAL